MASITRSNPKLDIPIVNLASKQLNVGQTFKALSMVIDTQHGKLMPNYVNKNQMMSQKQKSHP